MAAFVLPHAQKVTAEIYPVQPIVKFYIPNFIFAARNSSPKMIEAGSSR
jgi:hypothetical protein